MYNDVRYLLFALKILVCANRQQELTADKMLENLRKLENELKEMSKKYNTLKQQFERTNEVSCLQGGKAYCLIDQ